jgi:anti-sigma factor RsiW
MLEQHGASRSQHGTFFRRRRVLTAALVAVVLLPTGWLAYEVSSQRFFEHVCEDHAKYLNADSQVRSPDPSVIESWFRDKTEFGVRVPTFESASLVGGRLCFLKKRKAALIFYRKHDRTVSLFQFNGSGLSLHSLDRAVIDGVPIWRASFKGFSLAAFQHRGVIYVLVSDLRESELLEMASAAQAESRGY